MSTNIRKSKRGVFSQILIYFTTLLLLLALGVALGWLAVNNGVAAKLLEKYTGKPASSDVVSSGGVPVTSTGGGNDGGYGERFAHAVFVGDSLTHGMSQYGYVDESQVLAKDGMTIEQAMDDTIETDYGDITILEGLGTIRPDTVYVMLGTNGVSFLDSDVMIEQYSELMDDFEGMLPDATYCVMSIPPVSKGKEKSANPIYNDEIDEYNAKLKALAADRDWTFIDLNGFLKNDEGVMPDDYVVSDGMHLNKETYPMVLDFISEQSPR